MRNFKWLGVMWVLAVGCQNALAQDNIAAITVNVTINASPCVINNNQNIDVDFGSEVAVTDVAAGLVEKPISYELDCSSADITKQLSMVIEGTGAEFNTDVLQTSVTDLGVKIKANGADFPLNSDFAMANADAKPELTALLVQKPGARLQTGAFSAGATMKVDYQ